MRLHWLDIFILVAYFVATVWLGLHFSKKNKNTEDYFLGGRSFPGWAIGISLIGTMISSVTFLAYPADAFKTAWVRFIPNLAFPFVVAFSAYFFIPFFRRGTVTSAYQYLSLRFGSGVSAYAAVLFLLMQVFRAATITYLLSLLLAPLIGFSVEWCILLAGGLTAIYVVKGGFEAVVWTEVVQTLILLAGAVVSLLVVIHALPGGVGQIVSEAWAAGKLSFMDLNTSTNQLESLPIGFSLSEKTITMLFFVGFIQYLTGKLDQTTVQRWCSARTAKEAKKSMVVLGIGSLPVWGGFMFLGTALWVYFQHNPTLVSTGILDGTRKAEEIVPHFIVEVLPPGVSGLVVAAAIAAAMSTLGGSISAASMVWVNDIYRPFLVRSRSDKHYLQMGLLSSLSIAVSMILLAFWFHNAETKTFAEFGIIIGALLGGGISSAFLLGMLTRVGDARSVLVGIACTLLFTGWAMLMQFKFIQPWFDLYYTALLGNVVMFGTSYIAARLIKAPERDLTNLTIWDNSKDPLV